MTANFRANREKLIATLLANPVLNLVKKHLKTFEIQLNTPK